MSVVPPGCARRRAAAFSVDPIEHRYRVFLLPCIALTDRTRIDERHPVRASLPGYGCSMADVEVTREGNVLTITLNRPDVLNALNSSVHRGLYAALERAQDPAIRAVVITGAGRGFCVGQDLQEFSSGAGDVADNLRANYHRTVLAIRSLQKPVIAAVNGAAAGAGLSLALACDVRIAADAASFVPAFIKIGLVPDSGSTWLVRRVLGAARAFDWLTSGRRLGADEALAWGLVSEVVPGERLTERIQEVAELYAAMPTRAVGQTKRLLDSAESSTFAEQLELEAVTQAQMTRTPDFREGVAAFLEKREPAFTGEPPAG
jgi:2-(1,2-epoxy-1,2-dihydrophenyl)acetyl-CoA isomerase